MARGQVFKRGVGYGYRIDIGPDPQTGQRRQRSKQGFRTKREAEAAMSEALSALSRNELTSRSNEFLYDYLAGWLDRKRTDLKPSTFESYRKAVKRITAGLGRIRVQSLKPVAIEDFYAAMLESGGRNGQALSPKTVKNTHTVLRKALDDAKRLGLIASNPAAAARTPRVRRKQFTTWSSGQVAAFLSHVDTHRYGAAFYLLATTGMRRGEVLGLRWASVDLDAHRLSVVESLTEAAGERHLTTTKTDNGKRQIHLDYWTTQRLLQHRQAQAAEVERSPEFANQDGLVFNDEIGRPIKPEWFSREFRRLIARTDLPRIRLHDLRHTYATLALQAGVHPKAVSQRLGHANINVTMDTYSHVIPTVDADSADRVADEIFGNQGITR